MSLRRKLLVGSFWTVLSVMVNQLTSFFVIVVLAHNISPLEFGIVGACLLVVNLSRGIMLAGLPEYLVKQKTWDDRIGYTAFWINIGVALLLGGLLASASLIVLDRDRPVFGLVLLSLCPIFVVDALGATPEALLRHEFRFRALALRQVSAHIIGGIAAIASVWLGAGLWSIVIQQYAVTSAQTVIVCLATGWRPALVFLSEEVRPALRFSSNIAGANILGQLNLKVVDVIVAVIAGPTALGIYQMAGRGLNLVLQVTAAPAQRVALSGLSKMKNDDQMRAGVLRIVRLSAFVSFPLFVGLSAVSREFVTVVFGPKWLDAIVPMSLLVLIGGPATITYLLTPILTSSGRIRPLLYFSMLIVALSALFALGTAPFGVSWVAGGGLLRSLIGLAIAVYILKSVIQLSPRELVQTIAAPVLASSFMALVILVTRQSIGATMPAVLILCSLTAAGGMAYLAFLMTFCRNITFSIISELKLVARNPSLG
jgi:O-antigen/teichoic acid export membrane protein